MTKIIFIWTRRRWCKRRTGVVWRRPTKNYSPNWTKLMKHYQLYTKWQILTLKLRSVFFFDKKIWWWPLSIVHSIWPMTYGLQCMVHSLWSVEIFIKWKNAFLSKLHLSSCNKLFSDRSFCLWDKYKNMVSQNGTYIMILSLTNKDHDFSIRYKVSYVLHLHFISQRSVT